MTSRTFFDWYRSTVSTSRRARKANRRQRTRSRRPILEALEPRLTLSAYYVDAPGGDGGTTGNNSNNGTSPASAWLTLARAFDTGQASYVQGGDTLYLRGGTYSEHIANPSIPAGSAGAPTTITNYSSEKATIQNTDDYFTVGIGVSYVKLIGNDAATPKLVIDGASIAGYQSPVRVDGDYFVMENVEVLNGSASGIFVSIYAQYGTYKNLWVHDNGVDDIHDHGIYVTGSDNTFEDSRIYNNAAVGIHVFSGSSGGDNGNTRASRNVIRNNVIYSNRQPVGNPLGYGVLVWTGDANKVYNNRISGNDGGINVDGGATNTTIYSNSFYNNDRDGAAYGIALGYGFGDGSDFGSTGTVLRNNISYAHGSSTAYNFYSHASATYTANNNSFDGTDPVFASTDPANAAYLKLSSNTPGSIKDAGYTLGTPYNTDFEADSRPQGSFYDIGADEYVSATPPAAPTSLTATTFSSSQINLAWTDNSTNETGFEIDRALNSAFSSGLTSFTIAAGSTSYQSTGLTAGTTYYYRVRSTIGGSNDSSNSNTANATTQSGGGTEVTFYSVAAEDGYIVESSETSEVGGTAYPTHASGFMVAGDASADEQRVVIASFNTSSIPDGATITSATLRLKVKQTSGTSPFNAWGGEARVDIAPTSGFGGSYTLAAAGFQAAAGVANVAQLTGTGATDTWTVDALDLGLANVNKTGTTQFRVYFQTPDNDNATNDWIGWYDGTAAAGSQPELVINYTTGTEATFESAASEDGYINESTETSGVGGTAYTTHPDGVFVAGDSSSDQQRLAIVSFNTAAIPDGATITSATLRLKVKQTSGTSPFNAWGGEARVDIAPTSGFGGSYTLAAGDFQAAAGVANVAQLTGTGAADTWTTAALNSGLANVNKTGTTQFRVYFATDDNDNATNDWIGWYDGTAAAGSKPELVIEYTEAMRAAGGEVTDRQVVVLTQDALQPVATEAIARWEAVGVDAQRFATVQIVIADLSGDLLGFAAGSAISIDRDAAGYGWYTDALFADNLDFLTEKEGVGMDLLTLLSHEFGHVLGLGHEKSGAMSATLDEGVRELPTVDDLAESVVLEHHLRAHHLSAIYQLGFLSALEDLDHGRHWALEVHAAVDAEPGVGPGSHFVDERLVDLAFAQQQDTDLLLPEFEDGPGVEDEELLEPIGVEVFELGEEPLDQPVQRRLAR